MREIDRRGFLQTTAAIGAAHLLSKPLGARPQTGMRLGLILGVEKDPDAAIKKVKDLGLPTCQTGIEHFSPELGERLKAALDKYGIEATAVNTSGPGPLVYDFYQGPLTIGLVPKKYRQARIDQLKRASDFAKSIGIPAVHTHCGFIPENPNDPVYKEAVDAIRQVVSHCKDNGQIFLFETGQETPITLLRAITDIGLDNGRVNLDTANLILYGKGNPVDAMDVIGKLIAGLHAKDGLFPTDPHKLGEEVPIGKGKANFPEIIRRLKALNYTGPITIEREISGPRQLEDIKKEKLYLEKLIAGG